MGKIDVVLPKMGESVAEATIIKWLKNEGEKVEAEEAILEIATDKVDSEVPSPEEGVLVKQLFNEGDVVQVGSVIAHIDSSNSSGETVPSSNGQQQEKENDQSEKFQKSATPQERRVAVSEPSVSTPVLPSNQGHRFYSPAVRTIASQEGIPVSELETITGSGKDNRVTKLDLLNYLQNRSITKPETTREVNETGSESEKPTAATAIAPTSTPQPEITVSGSDEIIEMDRMRKLIAEHMVMSKQVSPHVTSYIEADVTKIVNWRNKNKKAFEAREGEKLTYTPIFVQAICRAIKEFPMVNSSVDGTKIVIRKRINIGMAAALPSGNLIVPVIKDADQKNLAGLAKSVNDLATRARNNKLSPDEIQGGTFTLTNVGTFGNDTGAPIINQPQVAIMATGAIRKKPAVIETEEGDVLAIRHMMYLSLSYDHRIVDGALGGSFLKRVAELLEGFDEHTTA